MFSLVHQTAEVLMVFLRLIWYREKRTSVLRSKSFGRKLEFKVPVKWLTDWILIFEIESSSVAFLWIFKKYWWINKPAMRFSQNEYSSFKSSLINSLPFCSSSHSQDSRLALFSCPNHPRCRICSQEYENSNKKL